MNALTALALRRITSEGSASGSSNSNSPTSPTSFFSNGSFQHMPVTDVYIHGEADDRVASWACALDGPANSFVGTSQYGGSGPVFNMGSLSAALPQPKAMRPHLSLLTDVGRKYPGFPTPLSPTLSAMEKFQSPASEAVSRAATPRALSPTARTGSPMSIDGSEMCGPSRRCESHGYDHYASMGLIDRVLSGAPNRDACRTPSGSSRGMTGVASPPTSPSRCVSPRTAMLKKMAGKQGQQGLSCKSPDLGPSLQFLPSTRNINAYPASPPASIRSFSSATQCHQHPPSPSIHIANGVESEAVSPIDPSGTMLFYTSNRSVDSGLLGVRPLSEPQVAEYRFWRPCGRRICAFGCGGAHVGEAAAAKRLFRNVEDVIPEEEHEGDNGAQDHSLGLDGACDDSAVDESFNDDDGKVSTSIWAGRRLVTDWGQFLSGCEREGIAAF
jgi:hypothetical protein